MTVHMIRIFSHWPDGYTESDINTAIQNWVDNHTEWTADLTAHTISGLNTNTDGSGTDYFRGDFRFEWSDDKTALLDDCETTLQSNVDWYRLGYHQCTHDGSGACDWDDKREWSASGVTIPSDIPDFAITK